MSKLGPKTNPNEAIQEALSDLALEHREKVLKTTVFYALRIYAQTRGHKKLLILSAYLHWQKQALYRHWFAWRTQFLQHKDHTRSLIGAARAHYRRRQLLYAFRLWLTYTRDFKQQKSLDAPCSPLLISPRLSFKLKRRSPSPSSFKLLFMYFHRWRTLSRRRQKLRWQQRLATAFWRSNLLRVCFNFWSNAMAWTKRSRAVVQARHSLLSKCFTAWKHSIQRRKKQDQLLTSMRKSRMHIVLSSWRQIVLREHQFINALLGEHQMKTQERKLKTAFTHWRQACASSRDRRIQTEHSLQLVTAKLRSHRLRATFHLWKQALSRMELLHKAEKFACRQLSRRALHVWVKQHKRSIEINRLKWVASEFYCSTLRSHFWTRWRQVYQLSFRLRQLDAVAQCRWSLRLQARAWSAWRAHARHRRCVRTSATAAHKLKIRNTMRSWRNKAMRSRIERHVVLCRVLWNGDFHEFYVALKTFTRWYWWFVQKHEAEQVSSSLLDKSENLSDAAEQQQMSPIPTRSNEDRSPANITSEPSHHQACQTSADPLVDDLEGETDSPSGTEYPMDLVFPEQAGPRYPAFMIPCLQERGLLKVVPNANNLDIERRILADKSGDETDPERLSELRDTLNLLKEMLSLYKLRKDHLRLKRMLYTDASLEVKKDISELRRERRAFRSTIEHLHRQISTLNGQLSS